MKEPIQQIVATGSWLYAGTSKKTVYVIQQNYDYWFEMDKADGELELGEKPELNADGQIYYVCFTPLGNKPWSVAYRGCKSLDEAKAFASEKANGPIQWDQ
jgi:hypothetical protein